MLTAEEQRARGNAVVQALYSGRETAPKNTEIWPEQTADSLNIQQGRVEDTCAITGMAQTASFPFEQKENRVGWSSPDVRRPVMVTPAGSKAAFNKNPHLDSGYMLTRPAKEGENPNTQSGRVRVTGEDAGSLTVAMDGWIDSRGAAAPGDYTQTSRLRLATPEDVEGFTLYLRMDDNVTMREDTTQMGDWNGW